MKHLFILFTLSLTLGTATAGEATVTEGSCYIDIPTGDNVCRN